MGWERGWGGGEGMRGEEDVPRLLLMIYCLNAEARSLASRLEGGFSYRAASQNSHTGPLEKRKKLKTSSSE